MKDETAFPTHYIKENGMCSEGGLTKREYIAAMALQGLLADSKLRAHPQSFAVSAVKYADTLIEELEKTK